MIKILKIDPEGYYSRSVRLLLARPVAIRVRLWLTGSGHVVITVPKKTDFD